MSSSFTHLHVHTEYSMLDGASRVGELVSAAVADGQPALGITDHGNMYGVIDFYKACTSANVKPIIGTEAYMAHETRFERARPKGSLDDEGGEAEGGAKVFYHLTLLAENNTGYKNLIQLASRAFLEGYYYKPKVDWELLASHSEGLIATTGCLSGHVLHSLKQDDFDGALAKAGRLQDIFGRENLFVEIQDHGIPDQNRTLPKLVELARKLDAPLLATNDSHYTHREDAQAHDALLCVQTKSLVSDKNRLRFDCHEHYLKSAAEMRQVFADYKDSCDNTLLIAERANVEIAFGDPQLPDFPLPDGYTNAEEYLREITFAGAKQRWGDRLDEAVTERLLYELKVISDMGFASYFLITWDLIRYARTHSIRVGPGRGSAAGCAVAYCLQITDLDPIRYDLLFERFLNPSRISMPDIDMDFDSRHRDEMIRYATEKYGRDHVAQIITFSTIKARNAVRDAARVLGHPYSLGDRIAKAMPALIMGRDTPLRACLELDEEHADGYKRAADLRDMYESDPDAKEVIEVAKGLEGLRRQDGIHAAAVVISKDPLTDYMPIQRKPLQGKDAEEAPIVTQYEMHAVEELGLLKMDFLGLRNLDVIDDAVRVIKESRGIEVDIDSVPLDDELTYKLLAQGDTVGVFQLESGPMRTLIRSLEPTCFDDVAALVALYRPGPMAANMHNQYADRKNQRSEVEYFHPDAQELLEDTYGLMIYQESVMRVAQLFAGYSLADADNLRKACGKKSRELMATEKDRFVEGCDRMGYGAELGSHLFGIIEQFADYAFNKSHSYAYGLIAYQIAYLKAHYPVEYMAALLTSVKSNQDKATVYLEECRRMGIDVLVPDVNVSNSDFTPTLGGPSPQDTNGNAPNSNGADLSGASAPRAGALGSISFGLSGVRHVGEGVVELIVAERKKGGPFTEFQDFCDRVDPLALNRVAVDALIKAGAFDSMGHPRQGLAMVFEEIVEKALTRRREEEKGMVSLFGEQPEELFDERVPIPEQEFEKKQQLAFEKEMLGMYVSDHPLSGLEPLLQSSADDRLAQLAEKPDGARVRIAGCIANLEKRWTRKGELMATFVLEDLQGTAEVMVFPRSMADFGDLLDEDAVVVVDAKVDRREETPRLVCFSLEVLDGQDSAAAAPLRINLGPQGLPAGRISDLKSLIESHPGDSDVYILLGDRGELCLPSDYRVDAYSQIVPELRQMLGHAAVLV